jgi:hypothetical protein
MEHRREGCADRVYSVRQESEAHGSSRAIPLLAVPRQLVPPETLKAIRRQRRVPRRVLDIAVPQVGLQRPRIDAVICELIAAGVAQHVSVRLDAEISYGRGAFDHA